MTSRCGCKCVCHTDEQSPIWPGPCAACCEPGMDCDCGRALAHLTAHLDNPTRTLPCGCMVDNNQLLMTGVNCDDPSHQR